MKIIFLGASFRIIWYMRVNKAVRRTYSKEQDSFRIEFLLGPCALLALLIHRSFAVVEVRGLAAKPQVLACFPVRYLLVATESCSHAVKYTSRTRAAVCAWYA